MQSLERISETNVKEIIKIMKIESYQDLVAVLSKFKPKSKSIGAQKDQKKKKSTADVKEKVESADQFDKKKNIDIDQENAGEKESAESDKLANKYWIRGHRGAMVLDFLSAFCSAHDIDLFAINPEYLIENWKNITTILPNELNKIINTVPNEEKAQTEQNQSMETNKAKKDTKKENTGDKQKSIESQKPEEKNRSAEKPEGKKQEAKSEKVFDIDEFIKESDETKKNVTEEQSNDTSDKVHDAEIQKQNQIVDAKEAKIKEYKIFFLDFDEFMELWNDSEYCENSKINYLAMKNFLKIFASPSLINEKALFLVHNEGKYYPNLFSEIFDYELTVPIPTESDRKQIFDAFKESNLKCTFEAKILASATHMWTLWDIKKLISNAIHRFSLGLCKYDSINSDYLLSLINSEKVLPKKSVKLIGIKGSETISESKGTLLHSQASTTDLSDLQLSMVDSLTDQLYQEAAFKDFDNVSRIIQDLISNKPMTPDDMKIISKYAFILNDDPKKALSKINQAKTRVDRIRKLKDK